MSTLGPIPNQTRPGIALVSISRLGKLCETVAPRYMERAKFFSVREGYGAAVTALQAYVDAGTVDVVLAAGSNGLYLRENLSVPVVMVKVNGFDVLSAITQAITMWPGAPIGRTPAGRCPRSGRCEPGTGYASPGASPSSTGTFSGSI